MLFDYKTYFKDYMLSYVICNKLTFFYIYYKSIKIIILFLFKWFLILFYIFFVWVGFHQGRWHYGLPKIKKASNLGLKTATYLLSLIYLCNKNEKLKKESLKMLSSLITEISRSRILRCMIRFSTMMNTIWVKSRINLVIKPELYCKICKNTRIR